AVHGVAAEELVAAVAGEHGLDVLTRLLRHEPGRDRRAVAERLIELIEHALDEGRAAVAEADAQLVMARAEALGDHARERRLVDAHVVEPDGEGVERLA